jgi:hypothetical protein
MGRTADLVFHGVTFGSSRLSILVQLSPAEGPARLRRLRLGHSGLLVGLPT